MSTNYKATQLKVIIGYVLLILLLVYSVNYIYQKMNILTESETYEDKLNEQRRITYRVLSQLYQAEVIGQSVSAGQQSEFRRYQCALDSSRQAIEDLQAIQSDEIQANRLDTIVFLLKRKEWNMYNLLQAMNEANTGQIYQQKIERIIQRQDTLTVPRPKKIQQKVVVREKSYVVKQKRPGFFKRLAEVFVPPKEDSTLVTNTQRELVTDTLVNAYNPADTVATILRTIQTQVSDSILHVQGNVQEKINSFKRTGWDLSLRMNQILQAFEQEEQALINQRLQLEQNVRSKSVHTIAIVAIMAIILVVVFLFFIERDILRSNHYRQELEKSKRRAEGLLMAREKLMLTITHDIKAPVGSILGYIDLLTRLLKEERQRFYLQNMKSSARHLLDLVSSLLDYHKLESHKMEVNQIPFNPYELFQTIYTSFEPLANKKNLQLRFEGDERLNRFYMGDPFRIRQVADNLLSNALKFTRQGSITLHIELRDARFHFSVTDTGSGISMEEQKHMFEEFTRLQNAQGQEGFGLGLAITQRLIVLMNGDIRVDSHPGQGSRFTVSLPLHLAAGDTSPKAAEEKVPAATVRPKVPLPDGQQIRLLFIDDDRIQLDLTKAMLHHPQLEVHCCESPDVLFQQLEKNTYDLLFTDIQMPGLNGFELLKELRRLPCEQARRIPVIALTARSEIDEQQFIAEGFSGCLHKPYSKKEVIRLIEQQTGWTLAAISLPTPSATTLLRTDDGSFNFAALTAFSEDDAEASDEIIRSFIEETRQNKARLEEAVKAGDCQAIRSIAHKLLPLFTMIEAKECVPILKELEREPYEEATASVAQKINIVLLQMEKIIKEAQHRH